MPNAGNHRQLALGYGVGQVVVVERAEVGGRASAANDYHAVEAVGVAVNAVESLDDGGRGVAALHAGLEQCGVEYNPRFVVAELVNEVAITGSAGCRYYGNALRHHRHCQLAVVVNHPFAFQPLKDFTTTSFHVAECIAWVDIADNK